MVFKREPFRFFASLMALVMSVAAFAQEKPSTTAAPAPGGLPPAPTPAPSAPAVPSAKTPSTAFADPEAVEEDDPMKEREALGSIAVTNMTKLLEGRELLRPEFGNDDVFMTRNSTRVLDIQNIPGYAPKELVFNYTNEGIVVGSRKDRVSGGERIQAGSVLGSTQVLVYEKPPEGSKPKKLLRTFRITVTNEDLIMLLEELKALIGDVEGLDMRIVGSQVVIDGNILVPKDLRRVLAVTGKYINDKKPVINLAEMSPLTMKLLGEKMEEEIAGGKDRPRDVRVKVLNGRFFLEGSVDTKGQAEEANKICLTYVSERFTLEPKDPSGKLETPKFPSLGECISMIRVRAGQPAEPDPILHVRVDFVTMSRNYFKLFDFHWMPGISGSPSVAWSSDAGKLVSTFTATLGNLFPTLDTAASHGYARVLKTASLLVRDGEKSSDKGAPPEANLSENLQIYVLVPARGTNPASYQPVNVATKVAIKAKSVSGTDKINMDILAQQSELKDSGKSDSGPTIYSSDVKTSIVVSNGESAALGGLITERRNVGITRDPAQSKDPLTGKNPDFELFSLGRNHTFNDDKTQFIIFVTPQKLRNPTEGTETLKRKFRLKK